MEAHQAIQVHQLYKTFSGKPVVRGITLQVPRGAVYGFLGPNGSGKTTTIRMLCGLLTPDQGEGKCLGYDLLSQAQEIRCRTGYMTQKFSYWEDLTVEENLYFIMDMFDLSINKDQMQRLIDQFQLNSYKHQLAGSLSGGWKQRLALAACTLHQPELLLLDEPTAGVDPQARREFWDHIHQLAEKGMTVLVTTHYMDEAERCHRIVYINKGQVVTEGRIQDVLNHCGLITWKIQGAHLGSLREKLLAYNSSITVAPFGSALHLSSTDEDLLNSLMKRFRDHYTTWERIAPSMEDAFIHLMHRGHHDSL